jgi:hypothetical protein
LAKRHATAFGDPLQCCSTVRTVENYKVALNFLRDNPSETSFQGIKRNSVFNQLNSFHVTTGLSPCIGHDLFEGVICYDLALCLNYFVKSRWFTYEILNSRIQQFEYIGSDAANKPAEVPTSGDRLGGQAIQNWTLLRFLPLIMMDKLVNEADEVWHFVVLMIHLTALICASRISKAQVAYMNLLIDEYLHARYLLFPSVPLRPKHHYISHYASLTLKFGPLVRLWTMRFESKHSYFKQCIRSAQNFKNVTGMLAERHQLFQAYQLRGTFFRSEIELNSSTAFHADLYCAEVQEAVRCFAFTPSNTVVTDKVTLKGSMFCKSCYAVISHVDMHMQRTVTANCIMLVLIQNGTPFFVARRYQTVVQENLGALRIDSASERVVCFAASSMVQDHPLYAYRVRGDLFIVLKTALFDNAQ